VGEVGGKDGDPTNSECLWQNQTETQINKKREQAAFELS